MSVLTKGAVRGATATVVSVSIGTWAGKEATAVSVVGSGAIRGASAVSVAITGSGATGTFGAEESIGRDSWVAGGAGAIGCCWVQMGAVKEELSVAGRRLVWTIVGRAPVSIDPVSMGASEEVSGVGWAGHV